MSDGGLTQDDLDYLESIKHITVKLKSDDEVRNTLQGCPDPDFYEDEAPWPKADAVPTWHYEDYPSDF